MAKWFVTAKKADFNKIAQTYHISPVLARIIRNRDVCTEEEIEKYLHGTAEDFYDPFLMKNMQTAVNLIQEGISGHLKIRVIGDYDADGICSTYILSEGLKRLGADVDTAIPHRIRDGYGLNERLIEEAASDGIELIITCDNGIAASEQIRMAHTLGMKVIVTDHHEVPFEETDGKRVEYLPEADTVIDPKQEGCGYPFKGICGAVVAWKLMQAAGLPEKDLSDLLEPAAFATICDVMELQDENRIIVKEGIRRMQLTNNLGLKALMDVSGIAPENLEVYHIGFILGPCMNATGRLESATMALQLWKAGSREEAVTLATELKNLNDSRKEMTEYGLHQAVQMLDQKAEEGKLDKVLVVYLPECHESIAGIIAGRVREKYGRPTFVLTNAEEGVKGSGRSIENYDMYASISACKELLTKFGGHKMAAGISLEEGNIEPFRRYLNEHCELTQEDFVSKVHIDVAMPISYATEAFVQELKLLEPFGNGNPKPVFAQKNVTVLQINILGRNRNVCRFRILDDQGKPGEMVYFGDIPSFQKFMEEKFGERGKEIFACPCSGLPISITYYPNMQEYRGRKSLQIVMTNYC